MTRLPVVGPGVFVVVAVEVVVKVLVGWAVLVALGGTSVEVEVGGRIGVFVALGGTGVLVDVGGRGVFVAVAGTAVFVAVGAAVLVAVGGTAVLVAVDVWVLVAVLTTPVVMLISSIPTHSSFPGAFVVIMRSSTRGWLSAAAGSITSIGVTRVAKLGPDEASAMYPPATLVKLPLLPIRYCRFTC
jgi:hypothetical protein